MAIIFFRLTGKNLGLPEFTNEWKKKFFVDSKGCDKKFCRKIVKSSGIATQERWDEMIRIGMLRCSAISSKGSGTSPNATRLRKSLKCSLRLLSCLLSWIKSRLLTPPHSTIQRISTTGKFLHGMVYGGQINIICGSFCAPDKRNTKCLLITARTTLRSLRFATVPKL